MKTENHTTDHLYGFAAFLTTRKKTIRVGASANTSPVSELLQAYLKKNKLPEVSKRYPATFEMPAEQEGKKKPAATAQAMQQLKRALKDANYRESWKANIAMAFKDARSQYKRKHNKKVLSSKDIHIVANNAAEYFLQLLCDEIKYPKGR